MCMCGCRPGSAGVQSRRLHLLRPHAQRTDCRHRARRQRFAGPAKLRAEIRQHVCWPRPRPPASIASRGSCRSPSLRLRHHLDHLAGAPVESARGGSTRADVPTSARSNSTSFARRPVRRLNFDARRFLLSLLDGQETAFVLFGCALFAAACSFTFSISRGSRSRRREDAPHVSAGAQGSDL